jgi:predicted RNase H-like HicB family nuclease
MEKYLVVVEKAQNNYAAFSPDVPGCIATGETVEETTALIKEALQFHFESLLEAREDIPRPSGIEKHIADGIFLDGEIAEDYYITEVALSLPHHA